MIRDNITDKIKTNIANITKPRHGELGLATTTYNLVIKVRWPIIPGPFGRPGIPLKISVAGQTKNFTFYEYSTQVDTYFTNVPWGPTVLTVSALGYNPQTISFSTSPFKLSPVYVAPGGSKYITVYLVKTKGGGGSASARNLGNNDAQPNIRDFKKIGDRK